MKQLRQHHRGSRDGMFHGSRNEIMSLCSVEQMNPSPQWLFRMCRTYKVVFLWISLSKEIWPITDVYYWGETCLK